VGSGQDISVGKKEGVLPKAKFWHLQANPWSIVDFSSDIFLVQSFLGKFLAKYISYVNFTILGRLVGYRLLKCNWKNYTLNN